MKIWRADIDKVRDKSFYLIRNGTPGYDYTLHFFRTPTQFVLHGKKTVSPPDCIILFNRHSRQQFRSKGEQMINDFVVFFGEPKDTEGIPPDTLIPATDIEGVHKLFDLIQAENYAANHNSNEVCNLLLAALLAKIKEMYRLQQISENTSPQQLTLERIRNEILNFPEREWTVARMAKSCNLSESRFQKLFKSVFNLTPMNQVIYARLDKAKHLLQNTAKSVSDIAADCGYNSSIHFINQFKKHMGITPSQYRKQLAE